MHFILKLILESFNLDIVTYVGIAALLAIGILLLFSYLIFIFIMVFKKAKKDAPFEFTLIRKNVWAWIYVFNCFWLSAEIIACWQFGWLTDVAYYLPLWTGFIFCAIMAIVKAYYFKTRAKDLKGLGRKTSQFKD
jgi:hypothetical protein